MNDDRADSALKPPGGNSVPCSLFIDSHITQKAGAVAPHPLKRFLKLISICILRVDDEHLPSNTCIDCASVALFKREDLFACGCHTHTHAPRSDAAAAAASCIETAPSPDPNHFLLRAPHPELKNSQLARGPKAAQRVSRCTRWACKPCRCRSRRGRREATGGTFNTQGRDFSRSWCFC